MCCFFTAYLRKQSNRDYAAGSVTNVRTQIFPPDASRFQVTIRNDGATTVYASFELEASAPLTMVLNAYAPMLMLNEDQLGALIQGPITLYTPTGTSNYCVEVLSYNQYAQELIRRHVNRSISQLGAL